MMESFEKVGDFRIKKICTVSTEEIIDFDWLIKRKAEYEASKADSIAYFDKCIADIDKLLGEANKLSVISEQEAILINEQTENVFINEGEV